MFKAVVSVIGRDQKGVVARFATHLAERGINILDIQQQVVHGQFIMDMLVDLADMTVSLDELIPGLVELGKSISMDVRVALHSRRRRKLAILVSKETHCLEHLIQEQKAGTLNCEIDCVLGNHPDLEPIAKQANLPFEWKATTGDTGKQAHFDWLFDKLKHHSIDLVVLARYMQILPAAIVQAFPYRIINIHPSLLPYFPGANPYDQAHKAGVRVSGCTAHYVTESLDEGPIILQDVFHIEVGTDTAVDVRRKGQALEARTLGQAVQMHLDEKLVVIDDKVVFRPGISRFLDHENSVGA
ncbi:MAG: formyltetrahydrofolate deformylase [Phycisphaeraceae bacterium]